MGNVSMYNGMKDFLYMYNVYVSYWYIYLLSIYSIVRLGNDG